jgi:serine/threonine protein phosphatase 1
MHWIIGDIHGMLRPLETILRTIPKLDPDPQLVFVGDYVNRGLDSRKVIELLLTVKNATFLRGNHDDIFDEVLHSQSYCENDSQGNPLAAFQWFMQHGLDATLMSYGVDLFELDQLARNPSMAKLMTLMQKVPKPHRQFIRNLQPILEKDGFFVGHGRWNPDDPTDSPKIAEQLEENTRARQRLLWSRFTAEEILRKKAWGRVGYFGHTPVQTYEDLPDKGDSVPITGPDIVLLDTAAAIGTTGRLTAFCHETQKFIQANRFGNLLPS